ncbi:TIGR02678 family protein [Alicyclobacillus sp. ALC3]|uniref:TIGR02678 family protein n=1 Tax=Alicyclobacillus sp. ALC3 TaxID=2796143 RepID=UPI002378737A|nr:TIGR02678 family protein [Alicyclobacillus sp. ALC3]WDL98630.1 TIGR02678 family protein [Alicyclobacillus sp. ALC3]
MTKQARVMRAMRPRKPEQTWQEDRVEVVQALLNQPFISYSRQPGLYSKARDHYRDLRDWFHEQTGWSLILTRKFVKLEKTPVVWQPWMRVDGLRDGRDYALFTYGLWYLEGLGDGEQFLLTEMVEAIRDHLLAVAVEIDWTVYDHRLAMSRALKKLRDLEVIAAVEGDESDWARSAEGHDVLYEASPLARYVLRRFPKDLTSYERMEELYGLETTLREETREGVDAVASDTAALRSRRHRVLRRLLQEAVVYDWQWDEASRRYVQTQRASLIDRLEQWTGLVGHRYREGLVFTWPELTGPMDLFPSQAAMSDLMMLLGAELRGVVGEAPDKFERDENGCVVLTQSEFEGLLVTLRARSGDLWTKEFRELTSAELAFQVAEQLETWNMGVRSESGVILYPGIVRWHGYYDVEARDVE